MSRCKSKVGHTPLVFLHIETYLRQPNWAKEQSHPKLAEQDVQNVRCDNEERQVQFAFFVELFFLLLHLVSMPVQGQNPDMEDVDLPEETEAVDKLQDDN